MTIFASNLAPSTTDRALGGSVIERSLRFNDDDSSYLQFTPSSTGNRKSWTWSSWVKRGNVSLGSQGTIFHSYGSGNQRTELTFETDDTLRFQQGTSSDDGIADTTAKFRDVNAWYHIVCVADFSNGTAGNRFKLYVNGTEQATTIVDDFTDANGQMPTSSVPIEIGGRTSNRFFDGYMTEINFIDGQVLDPTYFGYTESQTGLWRPKRYEGTYGTNGFHLDFSDNSSTSTLGIDKSPNGNDFTPNNFSVSAGAGNDSLEDTPTNNFCTLNPLDHMGTVTASNGNLNAVINGDNASLVTGSLGVSSGKWYYEAVADTAGAGFVGWIRLDVSSYTGYPYQQAGSLIYFSNGSLYLNGAGGQSYGTSYGNGDVIGCAIDLDNNSVTFYKNNTSQGTVLITAGTYHPNTCTGGSGATFTFNFGQRPFSYTPPAGHKTLNSKNLPPNVPSIIRPQKHFETLLYTGNGSTTQNITGLEFKPDFVWIKRRDTSTTAHHSLIDSVRGDVALNSNQQIAEYGVNNFNINNNNSIDVPYYDNDYSMNTNSATYVAWCWKAGGAAVSNSDGAIASSVSVNTEVGFSIGTFSGTGSTNTVGTGLSNTKVVMLKNRSTSSTNWVFYHNIVDGSYDYMYLNNTNANSNSALTHTMTNTFKVGSNNDTNASGSNYLFYAWEEVPGFSKIGSYIGNGSGSGGVPYDGPYVHLGFRPAWVMIKEIDDANNWIIMDNKRGAVNDDLGWLYPDLSYYEESGSGRKCDFLSTGFKIRSPGTGLNSSNDTYIYMAFAEQPVTTPFDTFSNAR